MSLLAHGPARFEPGQLSLAEIGDIATTAAHVTGIRLSVAAILDVVQHHEQRIAILEAVVRRTEETLEGLERISSLQRSRFSS